MSRTRVKAAARQRNNQSAQSTPSISDAARARYNLHQARLLDDILNLDSAWQPRTIKYQLGRRTHDTPQPTMIHVPFLGLYASVQVGVEHDAPIMVECLQMVNKAGDVVALNRSNTRYQKRAAKKGGVGFTRSLTTPRHTKHCGSVSGRRVRGPAASYQDQEAA